MEGQHKCSSDPVVLCLEIVEWTSLFLLMNATLSCIVSCYIATKSQKPVLSPLLSFLTSSSFILKPPILHSLPISYSPHYLANSTSCRSSIPACTFPPILSGNTSFLPWPGWDWRSMGLLGCRCAFRHGY